jgi:hypothetical protein
MRQREARMAGPGQRGRAFGLLYERAPESVALLENVFPEALDSFVERLQQAIERRRAGISRRPYGMSERDWPRWSDGST